MNEAATTAANSDQIAFWNNVGGPKWVRFQALLDRQLDAIGTLAMDGLDLAAGASVLDVGCGCGSTTLELARRVGRTGRATGVDISRPMLALARERARQDGVGNAEFLEADAQSFGFQPGFDALFSRFGVMFFDDPTRAFTNLHGALRRDARLSFVCWQALPLNPWVVVPMMAAIKHVTIDMPASPDAPGPFAFADSSRVQGILDSAGFRDVTIEPKTVDMLLGGGTDIDDATSFLMDMGPLARVLGGIDDRTRAVIADEIREAIRGYAKPGGVAMPGAVWLVRARA